MTSPNASDVSSVLLDRHRRACAGFARYVHEVRAEQWVLPTPCPEWDVRTLVNHVISWNLIVTELLAGRTPAELGHLFGQDALGDDPVTAADASVARAIAAFGEEGVLDRVVHHPFGELPGTYVVMLRILDNTLHGWDLARAIGADEALDPDLVAAVLEWSLPQREAFRASGAFGADVPVPPDADAQTRLLGLVGRKV